MSTNRPRAAHLGSPRARLEADEQRDVCDFLDKVGALYCAVPNGGQRSKTEAARMTRQGVKPGAPDLLIFTKPKKFHLASCHAAADRVICWDRPDDAIGVAIEMKRAGATASAITPYQRGFGERLARQGWYWFVAAGADQAINELIRLGYGSHS